MKNKSAKLNRYKKVVGYYKNKNRELFTLILFFSVTLAYKKVFYFFNLEVNIIENWKFFVFHFKRIKFYMNVVYYLSDIKTILKVFKISSPKIHN